MGRRKPSPHRLTRAGAAHLERLHAGIRDGDKPWPKAMISEVGLAVLRGILWPEDEPVVPAEVQDLLRRRQLEAIGAHLQAVAGETTEAVYEGLKPEIDALVQKAFDRGREAALVEAEREIHERALALATAALPHHVAAAIRNICRASGIEAPPMKVADGKLHVGEPGYEASYAVSVEA